MMGFDGFGLGGLGMGFVGLFLMAGFWIAIIVGVVLVVRALIQRDERTAAGPGHGGAPYGPASHAPATPRAEQRSDALRILEERYARGEIDRDEFFQQKADLNS